MLRRRLCGSDLSSDINPAVVREPGSRVPFRQSLPDWQEDSLLSMGVCRDRRREGVKFHVPHCCHVRQGMRRRNVTDCNGVTAGIIHPALIAIGMQAWANVVGVRHRRGFACGLTPQDIVEERWLARRFMIRNIARQAAVKLGGDVMCVSASQAGRSETLAGMKAGLRAGMRRHGSHKTNQPLKAMLDTGTGKTEP